MGDCIDQALTEISECFGRWREPLDALFDGFYVGPMTISQPVNTAPWEDREAVRECWNLFVTVDLLMYDCTTRVVPEILRMLHAASVDVTVLHALMSPGGGCLRIDECAFCQGDVRPLNVELRVRRGCFLRPGLFTWEQATASDRYRQTMKAIHRAIALIQQGQADARRPVPLEVALSLGDVQLDEENVNEYCGELDLLLTQCRGWEIRNDDNALFRFVKIVCRANLRIPMADYAPIISKIAHSWLPTQFSVPFYATNKQWNREWVQVMIDLLCDPSTQIVGIRIPATGPSRELLERLCSGLRNNTKLQHLCLEWDLSPIESEVDHRAEVETLCQTLFLTDTKLQLDFLGFSVSGIADIDRRTLVMFTSASMQLHEPRFKVVRWEPCDTSSDCSTLIARMLSKCGVREVRLIPRLDEYTFTQTIALVQNCSTLESITDTNFCCSELRDIQELNNPCSHSLHLSTLVLHSEFEQPGVALEMLRLLLSRVGANLREFQLFSSTNMEFSKDVAELILKCCPSLESLTISQADSAFKTELADAYASGRCHIKVLRFMASQIGLDDSVINMLCDPLHPGTSIVKKLEYSQDPMGSDDECALQRKMIHRLLQCNTRLKRVVVNRMKWQNASCDEIDALVKSRTIQLPSPRKRWAFLSVLELLHSRRSSIKHVTYPEDVIELIFALAGHRKRRVVRSY